MGQSVVPSPLRLRKHGCRHQFRRKPIFRSFLRNCHLPALPKDLPYFEFSRLQPYLEKRDKPHRAQLPGSQSRKKFQDSNLRNRRGGFSHPFRLFQDFSPIRNPHRRSQVYRLLGSKRENARRSLERQGPKPPGRPSKSVNATSEKQRLKKSSERLSRSFRASGRTRTCNLLVRSQLRYPVTPHSHWCVPNIEFRKVLSRVF